MHCPYVMNTMQCARCSVQSAEQCVQSTERQEQGGVCREQGGGYSVQCAGWNVQCVVYSVHHATGSVQCAVCRAQGNMCSVQDVVFRLKYAVCRVPSAGCSVQSAKRKDCFVCRCTGRAGSRRCIRLKLGLLLCVCVMLALGLTGSIHIQFWPQCHLYSVHAQEFHRHLLQRQHASACSINTGFGRPVNVNTSAWPKRTLLHNRRCLTTRLLN